MISGNSLLSPSDDTASKVLVDTQTAVTRVKTILTECVSRGVADAELTSWLNRTIALECNKIENDELREQMRKAIVTAARKWHYELKQTFRILDNNLQQQTKYQPLDIDIDDLLRMTPYQRNVEFRKILDDGTSPGVPIIKDYQRSVKIALKAMAAETPKIVTRKDGKTYVMPLRNRAEMAVRYDANVRGLQELIDKGFLWAWTSSHPNCSPRCKDCQGRFWSLFEGIVEVQGRKYGDTGTLDGIPYRPIKEALLGPKGDGNGIISGYNCRHRLIGYTHGSRPPEDFSEAEIKREYAIDKQQRSYENRIRQMKTEERQLRAAGYSIEAAELRKRWRKLNVDYEIYSLEHDRAFYRYRCTVDRDEVDGLDSRTGELSAPIKQKIDNKYGPIPIVKDNPMIDVLSKTFDIKTRDIVITKRQYDTHIKSGANNHDDIFEKIKDVLPEILTKPDYIFLDEKHENTAIFISEEYEAQIVVKLNCENESKSNTILTIFPCSERRLKQKLRNNKVLYKNTKE